MPDGGARPKQAFLPYGRQSIDETDIAAVVEALRSDFLTTGPLVERFEQAFAEAVGAPHAVACSNGTTALHLAVASLDIGPADICVVPAITFVATANVCAQQGARVVFADVDPATGLMTEETLAEALDRAEGEVRAILPVHLCGAPVNMPAIAALAESCGAAIIEDACHALGTDTSWGRTGDANQSDAVCFSFHPVKTLTTGEGGMVTTRDHQAAWRMRRLRSHGIVREGLAEAPGPWWYEQAELGFNYRLPDVLCALGLSQLKRLPAFIARRRRLAARYRALLAPLAPRVMVAPTPEGSDPALHLFAVRIDFEAIGRTRAEVMERLARKGVGSQVHYIPVHRQPYWAARSRTPRLPGADAWYDHTLSLPLYPGLSDSDPARVVESLAWAIS
jgi:UDP-4-amino-4,6-dideoxy-N-acetyl-beta-L-altrosamine transaminase